VNCLDGRSTGCSVIAGIGQGPLGGGDRRRQTRDPTAPRRGEGSSVGAPKCRRSDPGHRVRRGRRIRLQSRSLRLPLGAEPMSPTQVISRSRGWREQPPVCTIRPDVGPAYAGAVGIATAATHATASSPTGRLCRSWPLVTTPNRDSANRI